MTRLEELFQKIAKSQDQKLDTRSIDYLIVGLGNPGPEYASSWHNLGFLCLEELEVRHQFRCDRIRFKGLLADTQIGGKRQLILKPQTYMNNSGESVREALDFYKLPPEKLIVIYDDFELALGDLRIRKKGGAGSHNGMKSIIYQLGTDAFPRIRIGYGPKPPKIEVINFVLSKVSDDKREAALDSIRAAADCVELIISQGIDQAMNQMNGHIHHD